MSSGRSSVYAFVEDLRGEGVDVVLDRLAGYGAGAITIAASYHQARDVTPHGAQRATWRRDGAHLLPDDDLFDGLRLRPQVQEGADTEPVAALAAAAADRGLDVHGWAVFLHSTTLGTAHPDLTTLDCFGGHPSPADLCPSHPDVRAYAIALARAVARRGVSAVVAESLHFGAFGHGYAHERVVVPLGPTEFLCWSLCFCAHCVSVCTAAGVDVDAARDVARETVDAVLRGSAPARAEPLSMDALAALSPALAAYAQARCASVTSLARDVATAVAAEGARLVFIDLSGAAKGYGDGLPTGALAAADAWQFGVDPTAVAAVIPGYAVLAYARDPQRLGADIAAYRGAVGAGELRVVLRPGLPDNDSGESLAANVAAARHAGADAIDFYCYGLQPLPVLDRITSALSG